VAAPYSSPWSPALGRLYWLPSPGIGNGLDAETWAAIADVVEARLLLGALREAGIPGYAARLGWQGPKAPSRFRIYVDTWAWSRSQDVISRALLRNRRAGR